ncbi:MAG: hypothetical protein NTZ33_06160 [Bacteroidetes bacterium]|nr:hypothetical protein [Bacteroidota bacterium]
MRYIDQDKIYEETQQGYDIFRYYFPNEDFKNPTNYVKIRNEEKTASAKINWYDNYWRITDFGRQDEINGMKGIDFVIWKQMLSYYDALLFIENVIIKKEISGNNYKKLQYRADYEMREMTPDDQKNEYKFIYKSKVEASDLAAIGRYVDEDTLKYFNCRCVESYSYCGESKKLNKDVVHIFKANKDYPIFVFDYGDFKKLYKPHELEKKHRFQYVGKKPKNFIYGYDQLLNCDVEFIDKDDEENPIKRPDDKPDAIVIDLFRCSGESDALNLHSLGFNVYWLNSESEDFTYKQFKQVDDLCEHHYQIMDLDPTGTAQALKNALKHIDVFSIELPEWLCWKKDFRGNPCKDLKDFINLSGDDKEQTHYNFLVLKKNARRAKFWVKSFDEKKKKISYNINMEFYYFFLKCNGFYQMESIYHRKAGYCYAWINGKVVDLIHPDNIKRIVKRFTKEWIKSKNRMDGIELLNKLNTSPQIVESNLESIDMIKCEFKNYDRDTEYLHFKNGSLKITKDKIEKVKHDEIKNYILGFLEINKNTISHLIKHNISLIEKPAIEVNASKEYQQLLDKLKVCKSDEDRQAVSVEIALMPEIDKYNVKINDKDFIYVRLLKDLAAIHWRKEIEQKKDLSETEEKEQNLLLANLMFVLGYHCQQYKDPGKPWMTFLQDMKISEVGQSSGRSGKSLLSKAPTFVRASFYKGGRTLDNKNEYQFFYDGLTEFHDYIEIDDMHEFADFSFFYTQVTGKREVNPKNHTPFTLEYENSGKMLISSNFELQNVDSSTVARLLNTGVSDYYHEATKFNDYKETRTPLTKFGKRIYDDFTEEEWMKFFNLIAYCIQMMQRFYKINPPEGNLEKRQLRRAMSQGLGKDEDFFNWANDYFIQCSGENTPEISPTHAGYLNTYIIKEVAFENLQTKLTSKQKSDYRITKFKKQVQAWCEYYGFELNPANLCYVDEKTKARRINKNIDGITKECIYISTYKNPVIERRSLSGDEIRNDDDMPF